MPRDNAIKTISLAGFVKGLNRDADPYQLELDESPDALNVDFGLRGDVSKRSGYEQYDASGYASDIAEFMVAWERFGGSDFLVTVDKDGDIRYASSTTFGSQLTSWGAGSSLDDWPVGIASLDNILYVTSLRGNPYKFDGTTWSSVTAASFDGTAARFPKAKLLATHHDRIFAANVDDSGTKHRSRVYWSTVDDVTGVEPEMWEAANFIDFNPDDGEEITALVPFGEDLLIFKNHSVQILAGKSEVSFQRYVVDSSIGTVSSQAVVPMGSILVFFDRDSGVWSFDGAGFELISEKINNYLLNGIDYDEAYKAHAFVWRSKLYLSVPWGSSTFNSRMFVWDARTKAWAEYDFGVSCAADRVGIVYGGAPRNAAGVYKLFTTVDDDGAAVSAYVETPWLSPEGPEGRARIRRLDLAFSALGDYDVTVDMLRDFQADAHRSEDVNTDAGGAVYGTAVYGTDTYGTGVEQVLRRLTGWGSVRFRTVKFKFSVDAVGDDFQLNRATMHYSTLDRVRGEA